MSTAIRRHSLPLLVAFLFAITSLITVASPPTQAAAVTPAGSLIYIKNHNIWLAKGDGTGQVPVTTNGTASSPYATPTQADNGTIAARKDYSIVVLTRDGKLLKSFFAPTLMSSVSHPLGGVPQHVAISPNGSTIAYSQVAYQCPIGVSCGTRYATGYVDTAGKKKANTTYYQNASWLSDARTLQNGGYLSNAMIHTLGGGAVNWFNDEDIFSSSTDLGNLEVSRNGKWLIGLRGYGSTTHVIWYEVSGSPNSQLPPPVPVDKCVTNEDANFASPTLAPDGSGAAWEEADGIWIKIGLTNCGDPQPTLRILGGSDPSWSKYGYRVPIRTLVLTKAPAIAGTAKVGKTLTVKSPTWSPAPTAIKYQWKRNGKVISGATKSSYRLSKTDAATKITVTVTASRSGYAASARTTAAKSIALYNTKKPKISGTVKVGKKLKTTKGSWAGSPSKITYQWYRGSKKIKGATKVKYTVKKADYKKKIRVKVTAKRSGYPSAAAVSSYTKTVRK